MEVLPQTLMEASMGGDGLMSKLQAAKQEIKELKQTVTVYKTRYQELSEALEVEEAKTDAERFARQEAEATTRKYRAEVVKARQIESVANEHCEAAESEVTSLEQLLATECSARAAADRLVAQLREDLSLVESNETSVYDQLKDAKAQACLLQDDLRIAEPCIAMLKVDERETKTVLQKEHQRVMETAEALSVAEEEAKCTEDRFGDLSKEYDTLKAKLIEPSVISSMAPIACDGGSMGLEVQSLVDLRYAGTLRPSQVHEQIMDTDKVMDETTIVEAISSIAKDRPFDPTEMPAFPEPAILRPTHTSAVTCREDLFEATSRPCPVSSAATKSLRWRFCCRVPMNFLQGLFPSSRYMTH